MVNYRGYLIHFRSEVLSWRFLSSAHLSRASYSFSGSIPAIFFKG